MLEWITCAFYTSYENVILLRHNAEFICHKVAGVSISRPWSLFSATSCCSANPVQGKFRSSHIMRLATCPVSGIGYAYSLWHPFAMRLQNRALRLHRYIIQYTYSKCVRCWHYKPALNYSYKRISRSHVNWNRNAKPRNWNVCVHVAYYATTVCRL